MNTSYVYADGTPVVWSDNPAQMPFFNDETGGYSVRQYDFGGNETGVVPVTLSQPAAPTQSFSDLNNGLVWQDVISNPDFWSDPNNVASLRFGPGQLQTEAGYGMGDNPTWNESSSYRMPDELFTGSNWNTNYQVEYDQATGQPIGFWRKVGDREVEAYAIDANTGQPVSLGRRYKNTNENIFDDKMARGMMLAVATVGLGAAGAFEGLGSIFGTGGELMGTGAAPGEAIGGFTGSAFSPSASLATTTGLTIPNIPTLGEVVSGVNTAGRVIGSANTISNATTGAPLFGNNGHIIDTSGGGTVTNPNPGGTGGGGGGTGTTTNQVGLGDIVSFLINGGLTAAGGDRQEKFADTLLSMYNEQRQKAEPWEEMLRNSYTEAGQQNIINSPQFQSQRGSYKQLLDRNAAKAGTLTNTMSGIPGIAPRGREAALQKFGYDFMDNYRKQPQSMVDLYTKNASDYKLLAAMGLATEAAGPANWQNFLSRNGGSDVIRQLLNNPTQVLNSVNQVVQAGGTILDWWNRQFSSEGGADVSNVQEDPGGDIMGPGGTSTGIANDPYFDNVDEDAGIFWGEDINYGGPPVPSIDDVLAGGDIEGPW